MTRFELAELLDREGYPGAADRIIAGENPVLVLGELRPFTPPAYTNEHMNAIATFQSVVAGRVKVT